jgi:quercetin dioxygenase-like cupin family protein
MRFSTLGMVFVVAFAVAAPAAAQTTATPPKIERTAIAAAKFTVIEDIALYFKVDSVTIQQGEKSSIHADNSMLYQIAGSTELSAARERRTLSAGEGVFISGGRLVPVVAGNVEPSTFLHFVLGSSIELDQAAETRTTAAKELYRTPAPIPDLKPGNYDLTLTRVTFPPHMPSNSPHHRSGAALYFIIAGKGLNTVNGMADEKESGSLIYEPMRLVHQWGNSGDVPFMFLVFNINPEGVPAVVSDVPAKPQ